MINTLTDNYIIKTIAPFFQKEDCKAYIVGGFLRDCLTNKHSCDVDVVVENSCAKVIAQKLADSINGYFVELDDLNKIYRVVFADKKNYVDVAQCVGQNIEQDLKRRDFTMNALAYDLKENVVIDVTNGVNDINNNVIREISEFNITDDPIRILRAFRFQSEFGFEFSDELKRILKEHNLRILKTAKERINTELLKLFGGKYVVDVLKSMDSYGILELIFPIVSDIKKIPPNSHHHLNLFEHSLETVKQVQLYYNNACEEVKEHLDEELFAGYKRIAYLKLGAFLHDVGKPSTWQIEPDTGRHRFIMHDSVGAKVIVPYLKDLKFSKKQIAYIQKIIKNHIYPAGVVTSDEASEKAYIRFFRKMENEVIDLIAVAYGDRMSALGPDITDEVVEKNIKGLEKLLHLYLEQKNKLEPLPKLLDGNDIMQILGIGQSRKLGEIIQKLKEAQLSSEVTTKDAAIEFIKKL